MTVMFRASESNRPFTRQTPLGDIFRDCPSHWATMKAGEVADFSKKCNAILAVVLGANWGEQTNFLAAIYDELMPDKAAMLTFKALACRQRLLEVLDWKTQEARERVLLVYAGVVEALRT